MPRNREGETGGSSWKRSLPTREAVITGVKWTIHIALWVTVLGCVGWVLQSDYHASVQFLGFVAMFLIVTIITWPLTAPLSQ